MKAKDKQRRSIYLELATLLVIAGIISGIFFLVADYAATEALYTYIENSDFNERKSDEAAESLQKFVDNKAVTAESLELLDEWCRDNPVVLLEMYDEEDYIVYDSINGLYSNDIEETPSDNFMWGYCYDISISNKTYEACLYLYYDAILYNSAVIAVLIAAFALFLIIFLFGIKKKINYLQTLRNDILFIESGNLDYQINIEGRDELAELAESVEAMSVSFKSQIEDVEKLSYTNQKMITEISHDLRTPLTSILLYAEILQNKKDISQEESAEYINKIVKKIHHMKDLSDHLLNYSCSKEKKLPAYGKRKIKDAFYDGLSDLCSYLEEQGISVDAKMEWEDVAVSVNGEYILRIFNNISSNIVKYADKKFATEITSSCENGSFVLSFSNMIEPEACTADSRGIGIKSIETMMQEMGGRCKAHKDGNRFIITLEFLIQD